jgi:pyruvate/2-oxoglutarate dehydrogenase complex dihydrolipoamide dehydrogenase (E3) component
VVPAAVFSDPEIGSVDLTEERDAIASHSPERRRVPGTDRPL